MRLNGERFYPVDRKTAIWLKDEYAQKLASNRREGLIQLTSSNPRLFRGYESEGLKRTFNIVVVYDEESTAKFIERVSKPLLDLSTRLGISAIASGVGEKPDLRPHTTIQVGRISPDIPIDQTQKIMEYMNSPYSHMQVIANILKGLQFRHNRLVMAPNTYICDGTPDMGQGVLKN